MPTLVSPLGYRAVHVGSIASTLKERSIEVLEVQSESFNSWVKSLWIKGGNVYVKQDDERFSSRGVNCTLDVDSVQHYMLRSGHTEASLPWQPTDQVMLPRWKVFRTTQQRAESQVLSRRLVAGGRSKVQSTRLLSPQLCTL